jgi:hypothetical protein
MIYAAEVVTDADGSHWLGWRDGDGYHWTQLDR